ncbi:MAG: Hsp33 family molecular chaperone HslO, partial [Fimbriimonadaceae bacterium]|nr:Hsp33 family molecular chaperone HslO [Alphaproteobacteria bacterium]
MSLAKEISELRTDHDDFVVPFSAEGLETRGRLVRLGPAVDQILRRHDYPEPVSRMLGEAIVLAAILGTSLKFEGRFILQTQSDGPISTLVVDFEAPDRLRAWAQFDADAVMAIGVAKAGSAALLGKGHLALTLDYGHEKNRYQGLVPLEGNTLSEAADLYFLQSEQIPTRIRLAVAENIVPGERQWRAGGILVQYLPESGGLPRKPDLSPGDVLEGHEVAGDIDEPDAWVEASALTNT